jgi:hypothetical protein
MMLKTKVFDYVSEYCKTKDRTKADSHISCRDHVVTMPFPYHAVPLRALAHTPEKPGAGSDSGAG